MSNVVSMPPPLRKRRPRSNTLRLIAEELRSWDLEASDFALATSRDATTPLTRQGIDIGLPQALDIIRPFTAVRRRKDQSSRKLAA